MTQIEVFWLLKTLRDVKKYSYLTSRGNCDDPIYRLKSLRLGDYYKAGQLAFYNAGQVVANQPVIVGAQMTPIRPLVTKISVGKNFSFLDETELYCGGAGFSDCDAFRAYFQTPLPRFWNRRFSAQLHNRRPRGGGRLLLRPNGRQENYVIQRRQHTAYAFSWWAQFYYILTLLLHSRHSFVLMQYQLGNYSLKMIDAKNVYDYKLGLVLIFRRQIFGSVNRL